MTRGLKRTRFFGRIGALAGTGLILSALMLSVGASVTRAEEHEVPPVCGDVEPLDIVFIIDRSGSMELEESEGETRLHWAKLAATDFVTALDASGGVGAGGIHQVGVVTFGGDPDDATAATTNVALGSTSAVNVNIAINAIFPTLTFDATPLKTGMAEAVDAMATARNAVGGDVERVFILLSDGRPNPDGPVNGGWATNDDSQRPELNPDGNDYLGAVDTAYSIAIGEGGSGLLQVDLGLMELLAMPSPDNFYEVVDASELQVIIETIFTEIACLPALDLVKTADPTTYSAVGDVIDYSFLVTNSGNVSLTGPVTIDDDIADDEDCPAVDTVGNFDDEFDPGEQITCTASYTITQDDLNAGSVTNVASASADEMTSPTDTATVTADQGPAIGITKTANPTSLPFGGGSVTYTYVVTNPGNVSLNTVTVTDVISSTSTTACTPTGPVKTGGDQDANLDPGETWTYTCTKTITVSTNNTATAIGYFGEDSVSAIASASVTVGLPQPPPSNGNLQVIKNVTGTTTGFAGGTFNFTVTCGVVSQSVSITLAAGVLTGSVTIGSLSTGVSCTVSELAVLPAAGTNASWGTPTYNPANGTVTIGDATTVSVTVNNPRTVTTPTPTPRGEVLPETTLPPTSTIDGSDDSRPGGSFGLVLVLLMLAGIIVVLGVLTPVPARIRRRHRRE